MTTITHDMEIEAVSAPLIEVPDANPAHIRRAVMFNQAVEFRGEDINRLGVNHFSAVLGSRVAFLPFSYMVHDEAASTEMVTTTTGESLPIGKDGSQCEFAIASTDPILAYHIFRMRLGLEMERPKYDDETRAQSITILADLKQHFENVLGMKIDDDVALGVGMFEAPEATILSPSPTKH